MQAVEHMTATRGAHKGSARGHGAGKPRQLRGTVNQLRFERDSARQYLDIAGTMLLALDRNGTVTLVNRKGCEILGRPESDILGKNWFDHFLPTRAREEIRSMFPKFLAEGCPERWENAVLTKGGERIIAWHNATLRDASGKATGTLSSGEDITERRRAEDALRLSEERYRLLAQNAADVIWTVDLDFNFTYVSPSIKDLTGYTPEEHNALTLDRLLAPESLGRLLSVWEKERTVEGSADPGRTRKVEIEELRKDGGRIWVEIAVSGIRDAGGRLCGLVGVSRDISARKKAQEDLERSEKRFRDLVDNLSEVVVEADIEGNITYVSRQAEELYGFKPEEIAGRNIADMIHPDDLKAALDALASATGGNPFFDFEFRTAHKDGHFVHSSATGRMVQEGDDFRIVGVLKDITERRNAGEALIRSERLFRLLAENARDMIYRVRLQPRLAVDYVSPSALAITGYSPEEYYAEPVLGFGLIPFEGHPEHEGASWAKEALGRPRSMRWQRKDGGIIWLELVNHPVLNASGRLLAVEGVARDITARKSAEDALRESEEKFRDLAEQSPNMILIQMKSRIVYANRRCGEILGFTREELYSPDFDLFSLAAPGCDGIMAEKYGAYLSGRDPAPYECAVITKSGGRIDSILSTKRITFGGGTALLVTITDITERKRSEKALRESEEKYRRLFESSPEGVLIFDLEGRLADINNAGLVLLGLDRQKAVGAHYIELPGITDDEKDGYQEIFRRFLGGEPVAPMERRYRSAGGVIWLEVYPASLHKDGKPQAIQVILRDITGRRQAEERIRESLKEKEVLLKEIHHRVKNNLQIIHSLLNMQARRVKDPGLLGSLRESQNRVRTMALIHERLYRSTDLSEIDFKDYIGRLAAELCQSFGASADRIHLELELEDVKLGVASAIPCGLIINELVSNSLKHGFPGQRSGKLRIALGRDADGTIRLAVRDTGAGLPPGLDFRKTETLGLQLVCTLVGQLQGSIEPVPGEGTGFLISFNPAAVEEG